MVGFGAGWEEVRVEIEEKIAGELGKVMELEGKRLGRVLWFDRQEFDRKHSWPTRI